ncbi:effector-associated domain EAD1-containing protein [Pelatocladus sp. BLCC-F211]|uniref:effector-associated domain EAD1-containing protein n=1 Tax=Pelatocladus sp. BLCC-F211 TaxID=3342752 RepID=UPI0035BA143E
MKLNKSQRQQLREAIMSAYRDKSKLKIMLSDELDIRLNNVVGGETYTDIVFNLIDWADEQGRLEELISAAYRRNPRNEDFRRFIQSLGVVLADNQQLPTFEEGPNFVWRGPENQLELQSFWQPEPELWDLTFLRRGIEQAASVCRIERSNGKALGTGFLVKPDILLTNYHVLTECDRVDLNTNLNDIVLRFGYFSSEVTGETVGKTFQLSTNPIVKFSSTHKLDYVLLRVETAILQSSQVRSVDLSYAQLPTLKSGISILQHPQGKTMQLALSRNGVTLIDEQNGLIQYVSKTFGGSSGSPCFNEDWQVIALHHAMKSKAFGVACEGILLNAIYQDAQEILA